MKNKLKVLLVFMLAGFAAISNASLVDNFESYDLGGLVAPWSAEANALRRRYSSGSQSVLRGFDQKVGGQAAGPRTARTGMLFHRRRRAGLSRSVIVKDAERGNPVPPPPPGASITVRRAVGVTGVRIRKKRMLRCNVGDRG